MKFIHRCLPLAAMLALSTTSAVAVDVSHGATVYANVCASCHDPNPLDNNGDVMAGANSAATIQSFITTEPEMQSLQLTLSATDVADVAAYLGSLVIVPQAGYWWNPAEGGRGFTIEQNSTSGNIFFATYLYTAGGSPTWYAGGPAPLDGATFSVFLTPYSGGQTLTGPFKPATVGVSPGKVTIVFSDASHAMLTWPGGTIPIERYEFEPGGLGSPPSATQPQSGYWWNPAEGGRGYTIEVQDNVVFVASYMYDASGNAVWYASGPAALTTGNVYQGNWADYGGGQTLTGSFRAASVTGSAGSLTIQFTSPIAGTLTLPDGRQIPIERFAF